MAEKDLKQVLKAILEKKQVLPEIRAKIRHEIIEEVESRSRNNKEQPKENVFINTLIHEYLIFNNFKYTDEVFKKESGQSSKFMPKEFLESEMNIQRNESASKVPLLYSLVSHYCKEENFNSD